MSRREFFLGAVVKAEAGSVGDAGHEPEVVVGRIGDFPVGEKKLFIDLGVIIESLPEGIRARSAVSASQFYSVGANRMGELIINRAVRWPAGQVFSIFTNESAYLDTSGESRS